MAERTCIVTRTVQDPDRMIRFVAGPDGAVVPDLKRRLPGRGVWVTASRARVEEAAAKGLFARGLKTNAKASPELGGAVDGLLEQTALNALGFARKAGECITGFGKVEDAIRGGKAIGLLHASDAAADGVRKLAQAVRAAGDGAVEMPVLTPFTASQMSLSLGAGHVIHIALTEGGAARNCLSRARALLAYRDGAEPLSEGLQN